MSRLSLRRRHGLRVVSQFVHPDLEQLVDLEQRDWVRRGRAINGLVAGLGFTGPPLPNTEPVAAPSAVTGVTAETNLYTPGTGTNAEWALIPQGTMKAPQAWLIFAEGIYTSTASAQTAVFTSRLGTSATPASNASLGATGALSLGNSSAVTNGLWVYAGLMTVRTPGASGSAVCHANIDVSNQAAGSVTGTNTGLSGNTSATVDTSIQQGFVVSVTPSATAVSVQLTQFLLLAAD